MDGRQTTGTVLIVISVLVGLLGASMWAVLGSDCQGDDCVGMLFLAPFAAVAGFVLLLAALVLLVVGLVLVLGRTRHRPTSPARVDAPAPHETVSPGWKVFGIILIVVGTLPAFTGLLGIIGFTFGTSCVMDGDTCRPATGTGEFLLRIVLPPVLALLIGAGLIALGSWGTRPRTAPPRPRHTPQR